MAGKIKDNKVKITYMGSYDNSYYSIKQITEDGSLVIKIDPGNNTSENMPLEAILMRNKDEIVKQILDVLRSELTYEQKVKLYLDGKKRETNK